MRSRPHIAHDRKTVMKIVIMLRRMADIGPGTDPLDPESIPVAQFNAAFQMCVEFAFGRLNPLARDISKFAIDFN